MNEFKTRTLADLHAEPRAIHRAVSIDLREDWPKALLNNAFDRSKATAWIAEGLLIYLPPEAQDRLFENITELSGPGSTMATEYVPDMSVFFGTRAQCIAEQMKEVGHDLDVADLIYDGERSHVIDQSVSRTAVSGASPCGKSMPMPSVGFCRGSLICSGCSPVVSCR